MRPRLLFDSWVQEEADKLERTWGWVDPERLEAHIERRIEREMAAMPISRRVMMRAWLATGE